MKKVFSISAVILLFTIIFSIPITSYAGYSYLNWHSGMVQNSDSSKYILSMEIGRKTFQMGDFILISKFGYASDEAMLSGISYTSSKPNVATIDSSGKVTMLKNGSTTITAKLGNKKLSCTLKIISNGKQFDSYSKIVSKLNKMNKKYASLNSSNRANLMNDLAWTLTKANSLNGSNALDTYGKMDNALYNLVNNKYNTCLISNKKIFDNLYEQMAEYQISIRKSRITSIVASNSTLKIGFSGVLSSSDIFSYLSLTSAKMYEKSPASTPLSGNVYKNINGTYNLYTSASGVLQRGTKTSTFTSSLPLTTGNYKLILLTGTTNYASYFFTVE